MSEEKTYNQRAKFQEDPEYVVLFSANNLKMGRQITNNKSKYCREHSDDLIIFNANIITEEDGKIWYGDLNVSEDFDNLKNVADHLNEDLYILMEGDARFGYENQPINVLITKARTIIRCKKCNKNDVTKIQEKKYNKRKKRSYNKSKK